MKKIVAIALAALILTVSLCSCAKDAPEPIGEQLTMSPKISQMRSICELAVMDCYYHNVAKFFQKDAEGILFWKKDKHFWIEYSGVVRFGIDASRVVIDVDGDEVTVTLPEAQVLSCKVDSSSLNSDSYIIDKNSAEITAEDETKAFEEAQKRLEETAANDRALISEAGARAQKLLEDYLSNIGDAMGKTYKLKWIYLDGDGEKTGESEVTVVGEKEPEQTLSSEDAGGLTLGTKRD